MPSDEKKHATASLEQFFLVYSGKSKEVIAGKSDNVARYSSNRTGQFGKTIRYKITKRGFIFNTGTALGGKGNKSNKVHTLDIAPVRSDSPPQKRSGMARVLKGSHSFTCTPTRSIRNRNEPYLPLTFQL